MKLIDFLNEIEAQGDYIIAVYDEGKNTFTTKHETHNPTYHEYVRHRFGDFKILFIYPDGKSGKIKNVTAVHINSMTACPPFRFQPGEKTFQIIHISL